MAGQQTVQGEANTPGEYVNLGDSTTPETGTGLGDLFVDTGEGTPTDLFPLGDVIDTSRSLSTTVQAETLSNLCSNDIPSAWWEEPGGLCSGV
jgi:hypothetical protein